MPQTAKCAPSKLTTDSRRPRFSKAVAQNAPIPSIAQRFDIRWQTAKKVLMELNLLANAKGRVPFERYKVNETELYKFIGFSIDHHSSRYLS